MIPRTIHQIWLGEKMPRQYAEWCKRMKMMNPDWQYHLWSQDLIERFKDDPYVEWMLSTNERTAFLVDRLRVLLLHEVGGIYCDADCFPVRPFKVLDGVWNDPRVEFVAGMRSPDRRHVSLKTPGVSLIDNTVLASAKGSFLARRLCDLYRPESRRHTGFSMGAEIIRHADANTCLLNYRYFYAEQDNMDAILLHDSVNMGSWLKPNAVKV